MEWLYNTLAIIAIITIVVLALKLVAVLKEVQWLRTQCQEKDEKIKHLTEIVDNFRGREEHYIGQGMQLAWLGERVTGLEKENAGLRQTKEELWCGLAEAKKEAELAKQRIEDSQKRMQDWEKTKEESLKAAKEAMFLTGGELFRKEAGEFSEKTHKNIQDIMQLVATLNDRVMRSEKTVNVVWRSLSTPAAAGSFAEIGLENTLKNYGLEAGRDFIMQYAVKGQEGMMRPDAVVFLPAGNVMVIDSKASQFFLELAAMEEEGKKAEVEDKLKKTMQRHIRSLAGKAYREALKSYLAAAHYEEEVKHIFTLMFVHSETYVETISRIDPDLLRLAKEHDIIISGPTGLASAMSLVRFEITRERQGLHQKEILGELQHLLGSVDVMLTHAQKLGRSIEGVASHYKAFVGSVNRNFLSKARRMERLGITLANNKTLPGNLPLCHVSIEASALIEGEADMETLPLDNVLLPEEV